MGLISTVGEHAVDPRKPASSRYLRYVELAGALAVSLIVGLGAYTATYRALVLVSQPPAAVPVTSQSPAPPHVPTPVPHSSVP
jgi:hypothetical protein